MILNEATILIIIGGCVLFGTGYFLPAGIALQGATFVGGLIGYIIFARTTTWEMKNKIHNDFLTFGITFLMSLFASLCLLVACNALSKLAFCTENRRDGFIILNFFFPFLIVVISWFANRSSRSR